MSGSTIMPVIQPVEGELSIRPVAQLHTRIVDAINSQEAFLERAESDISPMIRDFLALHRAHLRELSEMMARHGHQPDDKGSFMSLVHQGVAQVRDMFGDINSGDRAQIVDGERHLVELYTDTMRAGQPSDVIDLLQQQRNELAERIDGRDPAGRSEGARP